METASGVGKMKNKSVTANISEREVWLLDKLVEEGYYCSRSDAVRAFVRYGLNDFKERGLL